MKCHFIYSKNYDFSFGVINKLHPFDGLKFGKAWQLVSSVFKNEINNLFVEIKEPVSDSILLKIHSQEYLDSLHNSSTIAEIIEIGLARFIPNALLQNRLLQPIKLACAGTLLATEIALKEKSIALNFGGGYHHAFADHGEGFCFFADAALSILDSREKGLLKSTDKVLMVDVDAHRGNGFDALTHNDPYVHNFDMYSFQVYPGFHPGNPDDYPYMIPLKLGTNGKTYLQILKIKLERFLTENQEAKLVFLNAGNDILESDPLGGLKVNFDAVVERDRFILEQIAKKGIPTVVMTSGGYTQESHQLIAALATSAVAVSDVATS